MSQTLFKSTNIVVKGSKGLSPTFSIDGKVETKIPTIELDFIIQINGKLATHSVAFPIAKHLGRISLKDWTIWYSILELFNSLGYFFTETDDQTTSVIQGWIEQIYPEWEEQNPNIPVIE